MKKKAGVWQLRRQGSRVVLTIRTTNVVAGLGQKPQFGVRSVHFGTRLRGYNIKKGQGWGWDGRDYITAKRIRGGWRMTVPIRNNDPKKPKRRFIRGNCYVRTHHNEIIYFDPRSWTSDPESAMRGDGHGGFIFESNLEDIPRI